MATGSEQSLGLARVVLQEADHTADERGQNPGNEVAPHSITVITIGRDDLPFLGLAP
ncbi:MAG: hypothetical protein QG603_535, partial [Patescibacteria group bacterium]|nr:hypothetical protein [Patescibacteria group bacterium]